MQDDRVRTTGWRPIETAPKDGTTILVGRWDNGMTTVYSDHWAEAGCWCDSSGSFQPTHWMPLPEPPTERVDDKGQFSNVKWLEECWRRAGQ